MYSEEQILSKSTRQSSIFAAMTGWLKRADARLLILFFFVLRLWNITQPPLEIGHNWRQVTGLMVARNLTEEGASLFYPTVDEHADRSGVVSMEFPLLNGLHAQAASLFGYAHWYSRLINLIVVSFGLWSFYLLIRRFYGAKTALYALLVLTVSIWFAFARKTMPDTFSCALVLIGWWQWVRFLERRSRFALAGAAVAIMLGVLAKLPAAVLLAPAPLLLARFGKMRVAVSFAVIGLSFLPAVYWYGVHSPSIAVESGIWFHQGQSLPEAVASLSSHWGDALKRFYFSALHSFVFFGVLLFGLYRLVRSRREVYLWPIVLTAVLFMIFILRAGFYFHHHSYYIIPFVPVMALLAGYGLHQVERHIPRLAIVLAVAGSVEAIANQQHDFFTKDSERYKMALETFVPAHTESEDFVIVNGNGNPQQLYLSKRKGWVISDEEVFDRELIGDLVSRGADFLLLNKQQVSGTARPDYPVAAEHESFVLYKLNTDK